MNDTVDVKSALDDFFMQGGIYEFPIFCIARQEGVIYTGEIADHSVAGKN